MEVTRVQPYRTNNVHRTSTTSTLIEDLHPDATYTVRVAGHTVEVGPYSELLYFHTLEDGKYIQSVYLWAIQKYLVQK